MRQAWLFISNPKKFVGYEEREPFLNVWKPSSASFLTENELRERRIREILKKSSAVVALGFLFFVFFVSTNALFSWMPWFNEEDGFRASDYVAGLISLILIWRILTGTTDIAWERIENDFALRRIQKLVLHLRGVTRGCDETDEYFEPQIEKFKSELDAFINKERIPKSDLALYEEIIGLMQCTVRCYRKQQQKAIEKEVRDQDRKIQNEEKAKKAQPDKAMEEEKWVLTYNQKTTRPSVSKEFDISSLSVQEEVVIDVSFNCPVNLILDIIMRLFLSLFLLFLSADFSYADEKLHNHAFSPRQGATELVVKTIGEAEQSVCVAAYSFTSEPIAQALIDAHGKGVDVTVVLDKSQRKQKRSLYHRLKDSGIPTRINDNYAIMHNKFMVIDEKVLQLGSFNYTKAAEKRNAENVLVVRRNKKVIRSYADQCRKLWDEADQEDGATQATMPYPTGGK
jgi:hypothetical protein